KDDTQERSYRIVVEEVPKPPKPGFTGVQTLLRISIPIFIAPKASVSPKLNWEVVKTDGSNWKLIATNHGSAHIQIRTLDIANDAVSSAHVNINSPAYLLPNQQHEWLIDPAKIQLLGRVRVVANTDAGSFYEMVEPRH